MPNWVTNELTITGLEDHVDHFLAVNRGQKEAFSFGAAIPYPEEFTVLDQAVERFEKDHPQAANEQRPEDGFNSGGYEWCNLAWGTKWDVADADVSTYDPVTQSSVIRFGTAWSPPRPWLERVALSWPGLSFTLYSEDLNAAWAIEVKLQGRRKVLDRCRELEVRDEDWDEEQEVVWGPWEEKPLVDAIWDGWERPAWTAERAMAVHAAGYEPRSSHLAERFGIIPGEEQMLLHWLAANHPDRLKALIERSRSQACRGRRCLFCGTGGATNGGDASGPSACNNPGQALEGA